MQTPLFDSGVQTIIRQNNSGGYFWLNKGDIITLILAGGFSVRKGYRDEFFRAGEREFCGVLIFPGSPSEAKAAWRSVLPKGPDPDSIGCTCCGPPFDFDTDDD